MNYWESEWSPGGLQSTRNARRLHLDTKSENKFVLVCIDVNNMFVIVYIKSVTKSVNRFVMVCIEVNNMFVMVYIKSVRLVTK